MERKPYLYQHYTWPELAEAAKKQPVVILPIGSVEDHGRHLPLDTDNLLIWSICEAAAQAAPGEIGMEHLLDFVLDVTKSVAHHGFRYILIADGHGSNMPILDLVARRTILETEALCGCFLWPSLAPQVITELRESPVPGGMAHACELETSVYLHVDPDRVQMDKAVKDMSLPPSKFIWLDLMKGSPVLLMDHWTRFSSSGVVGDPTLATADKGKRVFEAVVAALVELVREFRSRPRGERRDLH
jgi:creatinine amidohydrolase